MTRRAIVVLAALAFLASPAFAATFTVDSSVDAVDANPGDGICDDGGGACTLRAAVMEANAFAGMDAIDIPAGTYDLMTPVGTPLDAPLDGDPLPWPTVPEPLGTVPAAPPAARPTFSQRRPQWTVAGSVTPLLR